LTKAKPKSIFVLNSDNKTADNRKPALRKNLYLLPMQTTYYESLSFDGNPANASRGPAE
jgi:hypothetical protein